LDTSPLFPLIPYNVLVDWLNYPQKPLLARVQRFEAVGLFADVSGFTPMCEALGKYGRAGTEELTTLLNRYFTEMIGLIQSYGGIIATFGGDALTVLFPTTRQTRQPVARRAIECALEMQKRMRNYQAIATIAGNFDLGMKAGLALGPILSMTAGYPDRYMQFLSAGQVLDRCAEAEHHAERGQVLIHHALLPYTGAIAREAVADDFSRVTALLRPARPQPLSPLPAWSTEIEKTLANYFHPALSQRLLAGQTRFVNEHRRVTILFVRFEDFDYDNDPEVAGKLQDYLSQVIEIVGQYGGFLRQLDMGDKGSKFIVLFGTPVAYEDDEERALRCALTLTAIPNRNCRVGINTGFVFCGLVGSPDRQEYTVMGDAVNLAARLMQAAKPGQVIVSGPVKHRVNSRFEWETLGSIQVKGKSQPVEIFGVEGINTTSGNQALQVAKYNLPMVGRQKALEQLDNTLKAVKAGPGYLVGISGEAGLGKTRLAAEVIRLSNEQKFSGYIGECQSYGTNISYLPWQAVWQKIFGLNPALPVSQQITQLENSLTRLVPELVYRLPLLAPVVNLPLPDNDLTRNLDRQLRKTLLENLLVSCLARFSSQQGPVLMVLEDLHWLDPLSADLLEAVAAGLASLPVLVLMLYRPPDVTSLETFATLLNRLKKLPVFSEITLGDFDEAETRQLIELNLARLFQINGPVPPILLERLNEKAQGNPFYISELMNLFHDRQLDPTDAATLNEMELPDSLYSLVMSRIDRLGANEQLILKAASVIGRVLKARWLWGAYPELGSPDYVKGQLSYLTRFELILPEQPEPELEYLFRHLVTQEVAYESLTLATRQVLHAQIGFFLEEQDDQTESRYLDLLAFHFEHSREVNRQREYFDKAGRAAQAIFANQSALAYYQKLLPLLPLDAQSSVMLRLGEIWQLTGQWVEAQGVFQNSLELARQLQDRPAIAQSQLALGTLMNLKGSYAEALAYLNQAEPLFEALGSEIGIGQVQGAKASTLRNLGQVQEAVSYHQRAIAISRRLSDYRGEATELGNLGWTYHLLGQVKEAIECYTQSIAISREFSLKQLENKQMGNLAISYATSGQLEQALELYEQALPLSRLIGDRRSEMQHLINLGVTNYELGRTQPVLDALEKALAISRAIGDRQNESTTFSNLGFFYQELGRNSQALNYYQEALAISQQIGNRREEDNALRNLGELNLQLGEFEIARQYFEQSLIISRETSNKRNEANNLSMSGKTFIGQGQFETALTLSQQALTLYYELNDPLYAGLELNQLGNIQTALNNITNALGYWRAAATLLLETNSPKLREPQASIESLETQLDSAAFQQLMAESEILYQTQIEPFNLTVKS
jgi:class 3 adenylate cyclase/tetratricopeptide (TPR) repeat protein/ABC-type dipeptide/oligopeptide/nickel transport system ATPase subunit